MRSLGKRSCRGQSMSEFAASTVALFCCIIVPLVNVSFIPVRYMLCQGALNEAARSLALCEKRTDAYTTWQKTQSWKHTLQACGVTVSKENLVLIAAASDGSQKMQISQGQKIPPSFLPGASPVPFIYSMVLSADCTIAPFFHGNTGIPALTAPLTIPLSAVAQWENLAKDPKSKTFEFFLNE